MKIDKQNGDICFNEQAHVYFSAKDPKRRYISVTTLIHKFEQPFDQDFWSAYKAVEQLVDPEYWKLAKKELLAAKKWTPKFLETYSIDLKDFNAVQQNILDNWQKENLASTQRGSTIHSDLEHSFYAQKTDISLQKYGLGGRFVCVEGKTELDLENGIYPEYLIYYESPDGKLHIAGQIDLLVKEGNSFSIIDWKGLPLDTKIPTITGWTTMGDIKVGDKLFDKDGNQCSVIHKSEIHHNPCYKITFDTGESIIADEDHRWYVESKLNREQSTVMTTKHMEEYVRLTPDRPLVIPYNKPLINDGKILPGRTDPVCALDDERLAEDLKIVVRGSLIQRIEMLDRMVPLMTRRGQEDVYSMDEANLVQDFAELLRTLGIRPTVEKKRVTFKADINNIIGSCIGTLREYDKQYREIVKVEPVDMVPTQCIEVDSPTSTFLCTEMFLVTHNTNKQIKQSSYYDQKTKSSEKLKYPLNTLDNCNYSVYNMQLSTYAWMIQQLHPDWTCKELILVHFDHNNNMTTYHMDYLKDEVEKMLNFWKKEAVLEEHKAQRKRIEY